MKRGLRAGAVLLCLLVWPLAAQALDVWVDDDYSSSTPGWGTTHFAVIQDGIDAAGNGGSVTVAAGTYTEQLHIVWAGLTLVGAGVEQTIVKSPPLLPAYFTTSSQHHPVVFVDAADGVALADLTVDGDSQGAANPRFHGVAFWNAGGSMERVRVVNVVALPLGSASNYGIYAVNNIAGPYFVSLSDIDVQNCQRAGVFLSGSTLTAELDHVTVVGLGPTNVLTQWGIYLSAVAGATLTDCSVSDVDYIGGNIVPALQCYASASVTVVRLHVAACQTAALIWDGIGTFDQCTVANPTVDGIYAYSTGAKSTVLPKRAPLSAPEDLGLPGRASVTVAITDSELRGNDQPGSWGVTAMGSGPVALSVTDCIVRDWEYGVTCYDYGGGSFDSEVHGCDIVSNTLYGFLSTAVGDPQDATGNWWGAASGPYHYDTNPGGLGNEVSDDVDYQPFATVPFFPETEDAAIALTPAGSGPISCAESSTLSCLYTPAAGTPPLRGFSIRVVAEPEVSFARTDITVNADLVPGAYETHGIVENGANDFTIDWVVMGGTAGIDDIASFFDITFHGDYTDAEGVATVTFGPSAFRDLDNQPVTVDCSETAEIYVDCLAPLAPVFVPEPSYTQGLLNMLEWYDGLGSGAVEYWLDCSTDSDFSPLFGSSGWIADLIHGFTGLSDGQIYYYRVKARDVVGNESAWSAPASSTQDNTPPTSSASALAAYQNSASFPVTWTGSDATSGIATVTLWYDNGGGWTSDGSSAGSRSSSRRRATAATASIPSPRTARAMSRRRRPRPTPAPSSTRPIRRAPSASTARLPTPTLWPSRWSAR